MVEQDKTHLVRDYPLQRDYLSSIRLYIQHWMWKRQLGYLLHSKIPTRDDMRVADMACGTGIWLLDLAREYPSARLDGYDISNAQFPPTAWIPSNITLTCLDILKPIPEFLRGKYDIVHVGLVVLVVENDDPLPLLDNLLALLKPGGYIQWDEADFGGIYLRSPSKEISCEALNEVKRKVHEVLLTAKGTNFRWVRELCHFFKKRQLKVLDDKFLSIDDDIAVPWTLQHLMAIVEFIQTIDRPVGSAVDWWELYHRVTQDIRKGASMRMGMISILGQKPLRSETNTHTEIIAENPQIRSRL